MVATQAFENMLQNQIEMIIANRGRQYPPTTAANQSSGPPPRLVHLSVDEVWNGPTTQNLHTTAPVVRPPQDQPANVPSHKPSSSPHSTGSEYYSTQPTQPDVYDPSSHSTGPDPQSIYGGYLTDYDTSDNSSTTPHPDSSEVSWACTKTSGPDDNSWIRTARMDFGLEQIERQLKVMIETYHGSVRFDCFPVRFQLLSEEQNRHNFFWRFGPQAYLDKYFQHTYVKNLWYLIGE